MTLIRRALIFATAIQIPILLFLDPNVMQFASFLFAPHSVNIAFLMLEVL
jgi:hypothetical protein